MFFSLVELSLCRNGPVKCHGTNDAAVMSWNPWSVHYIFIPRSQSNKLEQMCLYLFVLCGCVFNIQMEVSLGWLTLI